MMRQKITYFAMVACLSLVACTTQQTEQSLGKQPYTVIPFEKGVENEKQVKLSEIAEKITFVPMETTDASLIARPKIMSMVYMDGKIVIPCKIGRAHV